MLFRVCILHIYLFFFVLLASYAQVLHIYVSCRLPKFHKYFSSFEGGNCVSNSSVEWTKNRNKQFSRVIMVMINYTDLINLGWHSTHSPCDLKYKVMEIGVFPLSHLTLSSLNLPLSSSSTTSRELLSQFSTCSEWKWVEVGEKLMNHPMYW